MGLLERLKKIKQKADEKVEAVASVVAPEVVAVKTVVESVTGRHVDREPGTGKFVKKTEAAKTEVKAEVKEVVRSSEKKVAKGLLSRIREANSK